MRPATHNQALDLVKLRDRFGPDAPAMEWDIIPKLKCAKCGSRADRHARHQAERLRQGQGRSLTAAGRPSGLVAKGTGSGRPLGLDQLGLRRLCWLTKTCAQARVSAINPKGGAARLLFPWGDSNRAMPEVAPSSSSYTARLSDGCLRRWCHQTVAPSRDLSIQEVLMADACRTDGCKGALDERTATKL